MVNLTAKQKDTFIEQLVKMTNDLGQSEGLARTAQVVPNVAEAERVFNALFQGPNGLKRVAFAMQVPLKNRLDYVAVGRKLILTDELPQGEVPVYDLDIPEFGAVKVAARGTAPVHEANIKRVDFPTFPISIDVTVKWEEIQIRRYPAFDRAKERAAIAVAIAEDVEIFNLLAAAALTNANFSTGVSGVVTRAMLADGFGAITGRQLAVGSYVMNPVKYADILKWSAVDLDQVSLNVIVETGMFGTYLGSKLLISTRCPVKQVYVTTTPDKLGRLPERKAVEIKIFDNIPQNQYDIVNCSDLYWQQYSKTLLIRWNSFRKRKYRAKSCLEQEKCRDYIQGSQKKHTGGMKRTGKIVLCEACGKSMYRAAWWLRKSKHYYCSKLCANRSNIIEYHKHKPQQVREKIRQKLLNHPVSKETLHKMSSYKGSLASNWRGGIQYLPWGVEFTPLLKKEIRQRDNFSCQLCGKSEDILTGYHKTHTVHHIDYDKMNNEISNLITLCRKCNSIVNFNREFWCLFFKAYMLILVNKIVRTALQNAELNRNIQSLNNRLSYKATDCAWEQVGMGIHNCGGSQQLLWS